LASRRSCEECPLRGAKFLDERAANNLARLRQIDSPDLAKQLSDFINKKAPAKQ